ncbi:fimbrial assembly protein [uncultured Cellulomonas sp.]|uniref:PilN domain-containing protein n=1 Tax=uncultured Cellulomonas sp. TaxID=189682 RepID=UPI0028F0B6B8|nr:fimbrial assembly protein [uncultured Cellulomonas sp.]
MTTLIERPRSRSNAGTALSGTLPQVNLLPPEVRAARGLRVTKRWLLISLVVTLFLCVGAFGLALISGATAASELADAQAETVRLDNEAAKYAEVPQVLDALQQARTARTIGMSTEVQWRPYFDAVTSVLPAGVSIESIVSTGATPLVAAAPPTDPLQAPSVGQLAFTARSVTVPDTSAWIDALNAIPGFGDAWVSSAAVTEDDTGTYYAVSATVQLTDATYSHRFDASTEGQG